MESTKDLQRMKPPLAPGEEIPRPQGRKMGVQEGKAASKVTLH